MDACRPCYAREFQKKLFPAADVKCFTQCSQAWRSIQDSIGIEIYVASGADSLQELRRPPRQTVKMLVNLFLMVAVAVWNIRDGLLGSSTALIIGSFFALWAVVVAFNLICCRIHVSLDETSLVINRMVRSPVQILWKQIETAKLPEGRAPAIISWRASPGANLQYIGVSQRRLGEEGAKVLRNAILTARPDLDTLVAT
ncbi:hypothetical protein G6M06_32290 [Agrobacterium rhizogenes]|jgi:hypothetical protein|nr:hypothetical protein [Rhizobium rhizogenes]NTI46098.1 hypothetical protein [Rhizobium rhizogenes]